MPLARRYRMLEFEELKLFPRNGLVIYAVRIVGISILILSPEDGSSHELSIKYDL